MKKLSNKVSKPVRSYILPDSVPPRGAIKWDLSWNPQLNILYRLAREYCIKRHDLVLYESAFLLNELRFLNWFLSFLNHWSKFFSMVYLLWTSGDKFLFYWFDQCLFFNQWLFNVYSTSCSTPWNILSLLLFPEKLPQMEF